MNFNNIFENNKPKFKRNNEKIRKQFDKKINTEKDNRRKLNKYEEEQVWNNSQTYKNFDKNYFRQDFFGLVCVKNLRSNTIGDERRFISYHFEHIQSHSHFGETSIENSCLLNATINNTKKEKELWLHNYYEAKGLCSSHGISFADFEEMLNKDIHGICKRFNIYFTKNINWAVKSYNYNDEYIHIHKLYNDRKDAFNDSNMKFVNKNQDNIKNLFILGMFVKGIYDASKLGYNYYIDYNKNIKIKELQNKNEEILKKYNQHDFIDIKKLYEINKSKFGNKTKKIFVYNPSNNEIRIKIIGLIDSVQNFEYIEEFNIYSDKYNVYKEEKLFEPSNELLYIYEMEDDIKNYCKNEKEIYNLKN